MTKSKVEPIDRYIFQGEERLFLDANVWLSVYGPLGRRNARSAAYSDALKRIRSAGCLILLDVLVVSEFINAFARMEYRQSASGSSGFKHFRKSASFAPVAKDIAQNTRRILRQCQRCNSSFTTADIDALIREFELGNSDFNDQMIAEICRTESLHLVTDDADFKGTGLFILTANRFLLKR